MKMKKKGKVYPSPPSTQQQPPSSSSSSSYTSLDLNEDESLSVLRLLPATILVLVSVLSAEDREVLAYLITRGTTISSVESNKKTKTMKKNKSSRNHKPPVFDCECFDCYTNYWFRWDSSPNRELIHEIIEAFENHHLATAGENSASKNKSKRGKKKEKRARRVGDKDEKPIVEVEPLIETTILDSHVSSPERLSDADVAEREPQDEEVVVVVEEEEEESTVVIPATAATGHKGLARKVLPDVLGLFNSNFWKLWNPNA